MKISELISHLEKIKEQNGDIDVEYFDSSGYPYTIEEIDVKNETVLLA